LQFLLIKGRQQTPAVQAFIKGVADLWHESGCFPGQNIRPAL
jgi:hypothetical protein